MAKDYYKILGIAKGASKDEIKKAYKNLAKKYHPDLNPNNPESEKKFKEINEAAAVLGDDSKRQQYDQFGSVDGEQFQGFDFSNFARGFGGGGGFGFNFDEVFENFFGGGGGRRRGRSRGADMVQHIEVTLEEVAEGVTKTIHLNKLDMCKECSGEGGKTEKCETCGGSGMVVKSQRTPFGVFQATTNCHDCRGRGHAVIKECKECGGEGRVRVRKDLDVSIPGGVDDGTQLRLRGEGVAAEHGGENGDLYVVVHVLEHEIFVRSGNNIKLKVPISFSQAVLGDEVEVPTLQGKMVLKIPSHTQNGTIFRMRGKGIKGYHGDVGDQLVKVFVKVPEKLSKKQKELVEELAELEKEKPQGIFKRFFG